MSPPSAWRLSRQQLAQKSPASYSLAQREEESAQCEHPFLIKFAYTGARNDGTAVTKGSQSLCGRGSTILTLTSAGRSSKNFRGRACAGLKQNSWHFNQGSQQMIPEDSSLALATPSRFTSSPYCKSHRLGQLVLVSLSPQLLRATSLNFSASELPEIQSFATVYLIACSHFVPEYSNERAFVQSRHSTLSTSSECLPDTQYKLQLPPRCSHPAGD